MVRAVMLFKVNEMMIEKKRALEILYNNIVKPAIDEDDIVLVDYKRARMELMMEGEHDREGSEKKDS